MARFFFDVTLGDDSQTFPVRSTEPVTLGSGAGVDLSFAGPELGPLARFEPQSQTLTALADGVQVGGAPLPIGHSHRLEGGEKFTLGPARVAFFGWRKSSARLVSSHEYFEQRGAEECLRAARQKTPFSILHVRTGARAEMTDVEATIASAVRLTDVVANWAAGIYDLILFDTATEGAHLVLQRLRRLLGAIDVRATLGLAHFPGDGTSIEALAEHATHDALGTSGKDLTPDTGTTATIIGPDTLLQRVAQSDLSVLILGETGSGKEVLAEKVHALSARAKHPLVKLNCASFSETLLESELFGHEKGSFTGAHATKPGLLETGDGGTVFLDEIGEMPASMQAKVLRVLEQHEVMRVGGLKPRSINVRFIAATHRDLAAEAERGRFRADLYYRLDGATLIVPPLRDRLDEFEGIANRLLRDMCVRAKRVKVPHLSRDALALLKAYPWPGNIRELRNALERALWLCDSDEIGRHHLPTDKLARRFAELKPSPGGAPPPAVSPPTPQGPPSPMATGPDEPPLEPTARPPAGRPRRGLGLLASEEARASLQRGEREAIEKLLLEVAGNQTEAARRLGVSRRTLIKRIETYGLARPRKRSP